MAFEEVLRTFTTLAGADLSAAQYHFVKLDSSGNVVLCAAETDLPVGILQNKPASGQAAEVGYLGTSKVVAHAAVTAGALIGTYSDGTAITAHATGQFEVGQARSAASAINAVFSVLLAPVPATHA